MLRTAGRGGGSTHSARRKVWRKQDYLISDLRNQISLPYFSLLINNRNFIMEQVSAWGKKETPQRPRTCPTVGISDKVVGYLIVQKVYLETFALRQGLAIL